jgi:endonuclease/exonuclease/phosphatase family metal-dependent hydrolase
MRIALQFVLSSITRLRSLGRRLLYAPISRLFHTSMDMVAAVRAPTQKLSSYRASIHKQSQHCGPLTIISANLWHDWPRYRELVQRLEAFARLVESEIADIILLQEVARTTKLKVDQWLAERLGMESVYARANGHEKGIGFEEGLAVLSRFPLQTPQWQQLGVSTFQMVRRMALGAQVVTPCGNLMVYSVHLGISSKENRSQLKRLQDWIVTSSQGNTAFIGGDFNTHETRSHMRDVQQEWLDVFRHTNPKDDGTTHEFHFPWGKPLLRRRLDYLFLKNGKIPWEIMNAQHISAPVGSGHHSDHRAVKARFAPAFRVWK